MPGVGCAARQRIKLTPTEGNLMRKFITLLSLTALIISGLSISGCNTMRGFGKDVERGGERVQDAAKPKPESTPQQGK